MRSHPTTALLLTALWAAGCTSRTLPLPPPEVQEVSAPDADGLVTVRGLALEGAAVGVLNDLDGRGVIVSSDDGGCNSACPFEAKLPAEPNDQLRVWQFFETASTTDVSVPEP